jgi:hypothetical protein
MECKRNEDMLKELKTEIRLHNAWKYITDGIQNVDKMRFLNY